MPTNGPVWDFESLLEEQRRREMHYADQREKIFEKVSVVAASDIRLLLLHTKADASRFHSNFLGEYG